MSSKKLVISSSAHDDLKNIHEYGIAHWGKSRAITYLNELKEAFWRLVSHPEIGISRDELHLETRSLIVHSHQVYYRIMPKHIEIIRVLHGRQDPQLHI